MIYLDTETCGLHGLPVLLQYAKDNEDVKLHNIWERPASETIELIEEICNDSVCGFNLVFDWFHLYKLYTTLTLLSDWDMYPIDHIDEIAYLEEKARFNNLVIRPQSACDIMLHARRGPYQSLMERDPIVIKKVPTRLAFSLVQELEKRIHFDDIYFARSKTGQGWKIFDIKDDYGVVNQQFKDIKLRFTASGALKNLYRHAFKVKEQFYLFQDIEPERRLRPYEEGYAPFALAHCNGPPWYTKKKEPLWPALIKEHCLHWYYRKEPRQYAVDDVNYTRRLHIEHFGSPEPGDKDSELAIAVACSRWRGYRINIDRIKRLRKYAKAKIKNIPQAPKQVKYYVTEHMDPIEKLAFRNTNKRSLQAIAADPEFGIAAARAKEVLDARKAKKRIEMFDKLIRAGRLHASLKIIGALSGRMSGADGFNPQGIEQQPWVRAAFYFADEDESLCGGDFKSFEVSIADVVFDDPEIHKALLSGKKLHAFFGMELFPGMTYEQVCATDGTSDSPYDKGKKGIFAIFYGGEAYTLVTRLGVPQETADKAFSGLIKRFTGIGRFGSRIIEEFGALRQPNGIGTKVIWKEPSDYVESFLGFRRYFTLENRVMKTLFQLAQDVPAEWKALDIKVIRRDRIQKVGGAVSSALYAAAFGMQGRNIRAAKNHHIQSPGSEITKAAQLAIWSLQPKGVHPWVVRPFNAHDELMCPTAKGREEEVKAKVDEVVNYYRQKVPLLAIDWISGISNWRNKKG